MKMQKRQFRIGQLAEILGVERFVVRFWEKEFNLSAHRSDGGQRFYEDKDLDKFKRIKRLLYEEGFTIAGAKKRLREANTRIIASHKTTLENELPLPPTTIVTPHTKNQLQTVKLKLEALRNTLQKEY